MRHPVRRRSRRVLISRRWLRARAAFLEIPFGLIALGAQLGVKQAFTIHGVRALRLQAVEIRCHQNSYKQRQYERASKHLAPPVMRPDNRPARRVIWPA